MSLAIGSIARIADHGEHPGGIHNANIDLALVFVDDAVAGKQQAQVDLRVKCLVREGRIAGPEDQITREIATQLLFQLRPYIDLAENAEALVLETGVQAVHASSNARFTAET